MALVQAGERIGHNGDHETKGTIVGAVWAGSVDALGQGRQTHWAGRWISAHQWCGHERALKEGKARLRPDPGLEVPCPVLPGSTLL